MKQKILKLKPLLFFLFLISILSFIGCKKNEGGLIERDVAVEDKTDAKINPDVDTEIEDQKESEPETGETGETGEKVEIEAPLDSGKEIKKEKETLVKKCLLLKLNFKSSEISNLDQFAEDVSNASIECRAKRDDIKSYIQSKLVEN